MYWEDSYFEDDLAELKQFRLKLIGFLRLPLNINESKLRDALSDTNHNVLQNYLRRYNRVLELKRRTDVMLAGELHNQP